jgi:HAD superfamily hydrolase (TIGR01509 family)
VISPSSVAPDSSARSGLHPVIFDLDGVLVDTEPLYERAFTDALRALGHGPRPELFELTVGRREVDFLPDVARALDRSAKEISVELRRATAGFRGSVTAPMPFATEAVDALRLDGRRIGIATSSSSSFARAALATLGIDSSIDALVCGDEVVRGKPDPETYLRAAEALEVDPGRCIAVEDSATGIAAAGNASMVCVALPNRVTAVDALTAANFLAHDLREVVSFIRRLEVGQWENRP